MQAAVDWFFENIDPASRTLKSSITEDSGAAPAIKRIGVKPHDTTRSLFIEPINESVVLRKGVYWRNAASYRRKRAGIGRGVAPAAFEVIFRKREPDGTVRESSRRFGIKPYGRSLRGQILGAAEAANEWVRKWRDEEGFVRAGAP